MAITLINDITDSMNLINKAEFDAGFTISGTSDIPGSTITLELGALTLTVTSDAMTGAWEFDLTPSQLLSAGLAQGNVSFTVDDGSGPTTGMFNMDTVLPEVMSIIDDEAGTANIAGGDVVYTVTFTEDVTGFDASAITIAGGMIASISPPSGPATTYMVTVTPDACLLYTSPSPRDKRQSRMPSSA